MKQRETLYSYKFIERMREYFEGDICEKVVEVDDSIAPSQFR